MASAHDLGKGMFTFSWHGQKICPAVFAATILPGMCFPPCQTGRALGCGLFFKYAARGKIRSSPL